MEVEAAETRARRTLTGQSAAGGEGHNRSRQIRAENSCGAGQGGGESDSYMETRTHRMKVSLAHMTGEEAPMWRACADSTSDQINSNM